MRNLECKPNDNRERSLKSIGNVLFKHFKRDKIKVRHQFNYSKEATSFSFTNALHCLKESSLTNFEVSIPSLQIIFSLDLVATPLLDLL